MTLLIITLSLLTGCEPAEDHPPACDTMCAAAAGLYGGCLESWGLDWSAAGYEDEAAFLGSCETWSWEMSLLEADAVEREALDEPGWVADTCSARAEALAAEDAPCTAFTEIDWNDAPWLAGDTGR